MSLVQAWTRIREPKGRTKGSSLFQDAHTAKMMTLGQEATAAFAPLLSLGALRRTYDRGFAEPQGAFADPWTPFGESGPRVIVSGVARPSNTL